MHVRVTLRLSSALAAAPASTELALELRARMLVELLDHARDVTAAA